VANLFGSGLSGPGHKGILFFLTWCLSVLVAIFMEEISQIIEYEKILKGNKARQNDKISDTL